LIDVVVFFNCSGDEYQSKDNSETKGCYSRKWEISHKALNYFALKHSIEAETNKRLEKFLSREKEHFR
jgi:hypothetical protein